MTTGRIGTSRGCREFRVHAALGVPPLRGLGLGAAPDRMNAELRARVTPCAPQILLRQKPSQDRLQFLDRCCRPELAVGDQR